MYALLYISSDIKRPSPGEGAICEANAFMNVVRGRADPGEEQMLMHKNILVIFGESIILKSLIRQKGDRYDRSNKRHDHWRDLTCQS